MPPPRQQPSRQGRALPGVRPHVVCQSLLPPPYRFMLAPLAPTAAALPAGPPVPHLALLVLLLLGSRSSSLLALALLLMGTLLATLHARGLRVVMRMDGAGRLGLAVIRHGGPVEGLGPGELVQVYSGCGDLPYIA